MQATLLALVETWQALPTSLLVATALLVQLLVDVQDGIHTRSLQHSTATLTATHLRAVVAVVALQLVVAVMDNGGMASILLAHLILV